MKKEERNIKKGQCWIIFDKSEKNRIFAVYPYSEYYANIKSIEIYLENKEYGIAIQDISLEGSFILNNLND